MAWGSPGGIVEPEFWRRLLAGWDRRIGLLEMDTRMIRCGGSSGCISAVSRRTISRWYSDLHGLASLVP